MCLAKPCTHWAVVGRPNSSCWVNLAAVEHSGAALEHVCVASAAQVGPMSTMCLPDLGSIWTNLGQVGADVEQSCLSSANAWAISTRSAPITANSVKLDTI